MKGPLDRLGDIRNEGRQIPGGLLARYRHRKQVRRKFAAELQDLQSYTAHLRSTIVRLQSGPMRRFKSWLRRDSACFALSRSLTLCLLVLAMLAAWPYLVEQSDWLSQHDHGGERIAALGPWLAWQRVDSRMLDVSSIGAVLLAVATPLFYFHRQVKLRLAHRRQFRSLRKFAGTDPDRLIHQSPPIATGMPDHPIEAVPDLPEERAWFSVLGVSPSASIEEVKLAYKMRAKQNHPDRVGEMSPLFRELAETETKKLNTAYEEALLALQRA
jgi:DnaJ-domain-containing protein 1